MRPLPGDDGGRSRSMSLADNDITPLATRTQPPQMTYFITDEKNMDASQSLPTVSPLVSKHRDTAKNSMHGVESLETTISSLAPDLDTDDQEEEPRIRSTHRNKILKQPILRRSHEDLSQSSLDLSADISRNASPTRQRRSSQTAISRPYTPLSFGSPAPPSLMSGPSSRRRSEAGSDMDDVASQAIVSSGDDDQGAAGDMEDSGSVPQLVMPSIKMPSRRPFTERGKNMGRLKVLIAGDSGVGKTSLIKAIVQSCEDIVHIDPISSTPISLPETRRKSSRSSRTKSRRISADLQSTSQITEVYASTRAYPAWWSDLEESRILRRRKSLGDSVLERNLCFVDTPGYGNKTSCIPLVIDYVESQLRKATSLENMTESDMINMLGGNGGSQVDLVLYVIQHKTNPVDIEYLRRLSHFTNVIPLVAQADTLTPEQLSLAKENIINSLQEASIRPFQFTTFLDHASSQVTAPYCISTTPSKDHETMDASLLMSPDYISPLVPSELSVLVSQVFDPTSISWLRYSAAKKFIQWREASTALSRPQLLYQPLPFPSASCSQILTAPVGATTSYALARITDHTQREERIAQVRLANWAADLQRSLQNERLRFENLARGERAVWLTERLGECVQDGNIIPISEARKRDDGYSGALIKSGTYSRRKGPDLGSQRGADMHDPLGLLRLNAEMKRKGWVAMKLLSGVGIFGGLAFWAVRTWQGIDGETQIWGLGIKDWVDWR